MPWLRQYCADAGMFYAIATVCIVLLGSAGANGQVPVADAAPCAGDCDGDGVVMVGEIIHGVEIALGQAPPETCDAFAQAQVGASALVRSVNYLLRGCPPSGWCFFSTCDGPNGFPMTKDFCCWAAQRSQQAERITWCSELDTTTGACAVECSEPCLGCVSDGPSRNDLDCSDD